MRAAQSSKVRAVAAVAMTMLALIGPANPASASPGAFSIVGQASFETGIPGSGFGCFEGYAVGLHDAPVFPTVTVAPSPLLTVDSNAAAAFAYTSDLVTGSASGTLTVRGTTFNFTWQRVGAIAVLTLDSASHTGVGVASFAWTASIANPLLPVCDTTGTAYATILGVGFIL